jgi:hypothetical protein
MSEICTHAQEEGTESAHQPPCSRFFPDVPSASSTLVTPELIRVAQLRKAELIALKLTHATISARIMCTVQPR